MKIVVGDSVRQATYPEGRQFGPVRTVTSTDRKPGQFGEQAFWCGNLGLTTLCAVKVEPQRRDHDLRQQPPQEH